MKDATSKSNSASVLALLELWDSPVEYAKIIVLEQGSLVDFGVIIEAPDCPTLELPTITLPKGSA